MSRRNFQRVLGFGFIGCLLGPFFAPVLVGRSLWEYRRLHRLEAVARTG